MEAIYCQFCNKQLEVHEVWVPCYDDGGGLDAIDVEHHVDDCGCPGERNALQRISPLRPPQQPTYETDDLPW